MLETVRKQLGDLIKLIGDQTAPNPFHGLRGFRIGDISQIVFPELIVRTDMDRFRAKARHFLAENASHIAILKLRRNEPLTLTDLAELERIFVSAGTAPEQVERIRAEGGLGLFVRSLVGLDREAAKSAFAKFLLDKNVTANQIEFLNMIVDHLTERAAVDPRLLYESPFTDIDPMGVEGVFGRQAGEVVSILDEIKRRAAA